MKTKQNARILFLLLALSTAISTASCASDDQTLPSDTTSAETTAEAEETIDISSLSLLEQIQYANKKVPDDLPERDYNGQVIKLCHIDIPEQASGSVIDDAAYRQYLAVMERFNCSFETVPLDRGWNEYIAHLNTLFLSGDDFASIVRFENTSSSTFSSQNVLYDLSDFQYIDVEKPWYFKEQIDMYAYKNKRFVLSGYMSIPLDKIAVVVYNKTIGENYDVENLYDVVREDRWTYDYVLSLCRDLYHDVNGDSKKDAGDIYALNYAIAGSFTTMLAVHEEPFVRNNAEGLPEFSWEQSDRMQYIMDATKTLLSEQGSYSDSDWDMTSFLEGKSLLGYNRLDIVKKITDTSSQYGILPVWKIDDKQKNYNTSILPNTWAIPVSTTDSEQASILLTALAAEAYREVVPASYETYLKGQIAMDEDSVEMLDLMLGNGIRGDGGLMYCDSFLYLVMNYGKQNRGFASFMESQKQAFHNQMQSVIDAYEKTE